MNPVNNPEAINSGWINSAITAAIVAGQEILKIYNDPAADFSVERKADNSPLTTADKEAHKIITDCLKAHGLPILSEEGQTIPYETRKDWKTFWLVDPLDGTREFIKRNGEFTVNIALIHENRPAAGFIYVPVDVTLYIGIPGQGAWKINEATTPLSFEEVIKNGQKLPYVDPPGTYTIAGSRSHMNPETKEYISQLVKEHPAVDILSKGSSLKICLVAEGAAHEYPRFGPTMEWDTAAGHAIANAAEKKLWKTDFSGELTYNKRNLLNPYFVVK